MAGVWGSDDVAADRLWFHNVYHDGRGGSQRGMRDMRLAMDRHDGRRGRDDFDASERRRRIAGEDSEEMGLGPRRPPARPARVELRTVMGHRGPDGPGRPYVLSRNWPVHHR